MKAFTYSAWMATSRSFGAQIEVQGDVALGWPAPEAASRQAEHRPAGSYSRGESLIAPHVVVVAAEWFGFDRPHTDRRSRTEFGPASSGPRAARFAQ